MTRRWTFAPLLVLFAASVAAGQAADRPLIQFSPAVIPEGDGFRVAVEGQARLPDGAILQFSLLPVEGPGREGDVLYTTRAEVRGGAFSMSPWHVKREDLKAPIYRIEGGLADIQVQPPQLRRALPRTVRKTSLELPLGDWRSRCAQVSPLAHALLQRLAAVTQHRDGLLAMAKELSAKRLSAAAWKAWAGRADLIRAREQCVAALKAPVAMSTFPRTCERSMAVVMQIDGILCAIDQELGVTGEGKRSPPERLAVLKTADQETPPDYLRDVQAVLAPEGAFQLSRALGEAVSVLKPGAAEKAVPAAKGGLAKVEKDLQLILTQVKALYSETWAVDVNAQHKTLLEVIEAAQKLVEETMKPSAADDAAARSQRETLWSDLRGRLDQFEEGLRRALNM